MNITPDMSLEDYVKLVEQFADERYGTSITAENSDQTIYGSDALMAEADERRSRMLRKREQADNAAWDCTEADMKTIKQKVHTVGNIKAGRFTVRIKNYRQDKSSTTANVDIYEEKVHRNSFGSNKMPCKVNVMKDMRFENRPWLSYFKNQIGGTNIPIESVAQIVRWCQAVHRLGAFL